MAYDVVAILNVTGLKQHLDVAKLAEVKVTLLIERVVLQFQFLDLSLQLRISRTRANDRLGNTAAHAAHSTG